MSWDRIEGQLEQPGGKAVHHWGKMINNEVAAIAGRITHRVRNRFAKEATRGEAISIARLLDVNKETVWEIIKGMKYSTNHELAMAVHEAFTLEGESTPFSSPAPDSPMVGRQATTTKAMYRGIEARVVKPKMFEKWFATQREAIANERGDIGAPLHGHT